MQSRRRANGKVGERHIVVNGPDETNDLEVRVLCV